MALSFSIDPDTNMSNLSNNLSNNLSSIFKFKKPANMKQYNNNNNNNNNIEDTINLMNTNYEKGVPMALSVFHPMCGHCHSMRPAWENAGKQLENDYKKELMIGLIHKDYVNKLPIKQENIRGYPHIVFISKKGETEYNGERNVNAFKEWIERNANTADTDMNTNTVDTNTVDTNTNIMNSISVKPGHKHIGRHSTKKNNLEKRDKKKSKRIRIRVHSPAKNKKKKKKKKKTRKKSRKRNQERKNNSN